MFRRPFPRSTPPLTTSDVSQLGGWWPWSTGGCVDNNWPVAAITARSEARYRLRIAISAYPRAFDAPIKGVPVRISPCHLVWKNWNGVAT